MKKLDEEILYVLRRRKGFSWWWDDLRQEDQEDIKRELAALAPPAPTKSEG